MPEKFETDSNSEVLKDKVAEENIKYIFAAAEMSFGQRQNPAKEKLLELFVRDISEKYGKLTEGASNQEERVFFEKSMIEEKNKRFREIADKFDKASLEDDRRKRTGFNDESCQSVKKLWEGMKKANPELTDDVLRKIDIENQNDINNGLRSEEG